MATEAQKHQDNHSKDEACPICSHEIGQEITRFSRRIKAIDRIARSLMPLVFQERKDSHEKYNEFLKLHGEKVKEETYTIPSRFTGEFEKIKDRHLAFVDASRTIPVSLFISLVSEYDAYLGRLARRLLSKHPEMFNSADKKMTYTQLLKFPAISDVQSYIVDKEISSLERKPYYEQFEWLEEKIGGTLRSDLPSFSAFIELTERRHLFVHCDGKVTEQYVGICKKYGYVFEKEPAVGDDLSVSKTYFSKSADCVREIGLKLGHVLWRKLRPADLDSADINLNQICYDILGEELHELADNLAHFGLFTLKKHSSEVHKRILIIDKAVALRGLNRVDDAKKLVNNADWSASAPKFNFAVKIINDDIDGAVKIMRQMGKDSDMKSGYEKWPLLKNFRRTPQFLDAYKEIFENPFELNESSKNENVDSK